MKKSEIIRELEIIVRVIAKGNDSPETIKKWIIELYNDSKN